MCDLCKRLARRLSWAEARQLDHLAAFIREIWSGACPRCRAKRKSVRLRDEILDLESPIPNQEFDKIG